MKNLVLCIILLLTTSCQYFNRATPRGKSYYETRWAEAMFLIEDKKYDEAESSLKELYSAALTADPELSTRALFELASINEKKGNWLAALSQFKECEGKRIYLEGYKAELELPARLAGLYATLGELRMSENYASKVEAALQVYFRRISLTEKKSWWAEMFFRMGSFPIHYINADNWRDFARRIHFTSQYLIRSMEFSDPVWSQRSLELAQIFFKKSFEFLAIAPDDLEENSVLLGTVVRDRINLLQEIFEKIQLYRPLSLEKSRTVWLFYQLVEGYQAQLKTQLHKIKDSVQLRKESQKRNAIEREGDLINPSNGGIDKNSNDPNL
jgi:hypothetical protein